MQSKKHIFRSAIIMTMMMLGSHLTVKAQFHTVSFVNPVRDTLNKSRNPFIVADSAAKLSTKSPPRITSQEKSHKRAEKTSQEELPITRADAGIILLCANDSLAMNLIKKRLTVCMPLDFMHLNSPYGYRRNPFKTCREFHDGIDLACDNSLVYAMLSGKVVKVRHGNTGYGNYVILDHGWLRFLYGHLSQILVREGDYVDAGKVVAVSGNTGASTGPHLHLKASRFANGRWVSIDPQPFIDALNENINSLYDQFCKLSGNKPLPFHEETDRELTVSNLYQALKDNGIRHPKIVLAQALLETGNFRNQLLKTHNNLFGLRNRDGTYMRFHHWTESCIAYRDLVQYKFRPGRESYLAFLDRIGYAADKSYIYKVKKIVSKL